MDVSQYLEIFIDESKEHLGTLNNQVLILEKEPENADTIQEIFRAAHSLKGMAGTMGYKRMEHLTHAMEDVFDEIRNGKIKVTDDIVDIVFQCLDAIEGYLTCIIETSDEGTNDNEPIISRLNATLAKEEAKEAKEIEAAEESQRKEEEKQEEKQEASAESSGNRKYKEIELKDFELHAAREAQKKNLNLYGFTIQIEETCILKSARAFLVFKSIESLGEMLSSHPSAQDIEDEKFEFDFSLFVVSKEPIEKILEAIQNVSEIKEVQGEKIVIPEETLETHPEQKDDGTEQKEKGKPVVSASNNKPVSTGKGQAAANTNSNNNNKPVVNRSVRVDIDKLDLLMNLVSELIIAKNGITAASNSETKDSKNLAQTIREQVEYLESITTNLHESVMKVRMVPIESVVSRFPRMIRDLSKKLGKKMELYMSGEETELDRTVIDEIGDPLMHILRNSADHGIESAEIRAERGKPEVGSIYLTAYQDGNNVIIEVKDDGNGIDVERIKEKAIEKGVLTQEQADGLDEKGAVDLLFRPSFSTSDKITDVSGRGVGLDVVKTKIEGLGGDIEVKTKLGEGSVFTVRLPLTLAIIQGLMVVLGTEKYALPLSSIQTIEDVPVSDVKYVRGKEVIHLRGKVIPIIRLAEVLDVENAKQSDNLIVVIVQKGDKSAGLVVDELIGQQEIVIKSLGKYLNNNRLIGGATILGDGEVALILDVSTLF